MSRLSGKRPVRYSKIYIGATWLISLTVALFALVSADFGGPSWMFVLCGLWLCTLGLPTTLSILLLAALWGNLPELGTPPLWVFAVSAAILSLGAQVLSFFLVIRFLNRRGDT